MLKHFCSEQEIYADEMLTKVSIKSIKMVLLDG